MDGTGHDGHITKQVWGGVEINKGGKPLYHLQWEVSQDSCIPCSIARVGNRTPLRDLKCHPSCQSSLTRSRKVLWTVQLLNHQLAQLPYQMQDQFTTMAFEHTQRLGYLSSGQF